MSGRPRNVDVLVVGGGPAGAAAAAELAARGWSVLLAEAAPGPRDRVCGEFVSGEAVSMLAQLGALRDLEQAAVPQISRARFTAPGGHELIFRLPEESPAPLGIRRRRLDEALLQAAARRGVDLLRGARFRGALRDAAGAVRGGILATADGPLEVRSRLLIGADGRASAVARSLGLDLPVRAPDRCAIKVHVRPGPGMAGLERQVEIHLFAGGYVGMQPVDGGLVNVSAVLTTSLARALGGGALRILLEAAARSDAARARLEGIDPAARPLALFPLDRRRTAVQGPGFLLAGDAAAVVPPFAGDGISAALRSGILTAEAADEAWGDSPKPLCAAAYRRGRRRALAPSRRLSRLLEKLVHRPALAGPLLEVLGPRTARALTRATRIQ